MRSDSEQAQQAQMEMGLEVDMEEMASDAEARSLVTAREQAPARWQGRLLATVGVAAALCGTALMWGTHGSTETSADASSELVELAGPMGLGAGDPVPLHVAPLRSADETPGHICKHPKQSNQCLHSGPQCQYGLYKDRDDCSITGYNLHITPHHLKCLNDDPKAGEYVPCNITVNYNHAKELLIVGGRCRYKGNTGSFMGCLDSDGKAMTRTKDCRALSLKVKVNKDARTVSRIPKFDNQKPVDVIGVKEIQLQGMMHDDSLLKTHLGTKLIRDVGEELGTPVIASCSVPANLYINGQYYGLRDQVEPVDDVFTKKRFANEQFAGKGTLWKEMWFESADPKYYENAEEIEDFAAREMKEEGPDGPHYDLFADFYREAKRCVDGHHGECTCDDAKRIMNKYTHPDSFLEGILGMTMVANSDQFIIIHHNFFFYIFDSKFYYVSWDFNQVLYDVTGSPIPGYEVSLPWYKILDDDERSKYCPYPVPSDKNDMSIKRFNHFTCDPVGHIIGLALKEKYIQKVKALDRERLVKKAEKEVFQWSKAISHSVECDALNGGWPPLDEQRKAALPLTPMYDQIIGFWKSVVTDKLKAWPSPTYADFPEQVTSCFFDGINVAQYLGQAGVAIAGGVHDCPHGNPAAKACSNDISNVLSSFGFVATFLSELVTECPITDSMGFAQRGVGQLYQTTRESACAAQSSRLIAGLAATSAGASGLSEMCVPGVARANREEAGADTVRGPQRRLNSVGFVQDRPLEQATCAFDVVGALAYLGRAGTTIDLATEQCSGIWLKSSRCSAAVTAVVEAFSYASYFVANSVAQCAEEIHFPMDQAYQATCAADISQLIGGLYSVASGGSGIADSCGKPWPKEPPYETRHLSDEDYDKELQKAKKAWQDYAKGDHTSLKQLVNEQFGSSVTSPVHVV